MERILNVVHENRARRGADGDPSKSKHSERIESLAGDVSQFKHETVLILKQIDGQVQQDSDKLILFEERLGKLEKVEERLEKLEKALIHSMLYQERLEKFQNTRSHQAQGRVIHQDDHPAQGRVSPQEVHVPHLDALSTKVQDIQDWRTEVDAYLQADANYKASAVSVKETAADLEEQPALAEDCTHDSFHTKGSQKHGALCNLGVCLRPCVWDYAFLVGLPENTPVGSAFLILLLGWNVVLQGFLCLAIHDLFTVPVVDDNIVSKMHQWRVHTAHRVENMDKNLGVPMARHVCSLDTPTSDAASVVYNLIKSYIPTRDYYDHQEPLMGSLLPYTYHIGIGLSAVACIVWCLRIVENLDDVYDITKAVFHIPVLHQTEIQHGEDSSKVVGVSRPRKIWFCSVLLLEAWILVFLGFTGVAYIINTVNLPDLLLNCSALAIVLDLDEYVAHCVPKIFQHMLQSMDPLPRPILGRLGGAGPESFLKVLSILAVTIASVVVMQEGAEILEDARRIICGGNLDFVVAEDATGVIIALKTPKHHVDRETNVYKDTALEQLVNHGDLYANSGFTLDDMSARAISMGGGPWGFQEWVTRTPESIAGYWNADCVDMLPVTTSPYSYSKHFGTIINDLSLSDTPITHCSQMQKHCEETTKFAQRVRQICPTTCGCDVAGYKLVLDPVTYGCPSSCIASASYNSSMWSRECEDSDLSSSVWSDYIEGLRLFFNQYGAELDPSLARIKDLGCQAVSSPNKIFDHHWMDLCEAAPEISFKPLTWACPVSCMCKRYDRDLCPRKCRAAELR